MARKSGSDSQRTLAAIQRAGIAQLYEHGYEAMSLRALAAAVDLQAGSLYNYFRTKEELLESLLVDHMQRLNSAARAALATAASAATPPTTNPSAASGARAPLVALVDFHVRYYAKRKKDVYVANSELRSLKGARKRRVVALRREYEDLWVTALDAAAAAGEISVADSRVTAYALIAMLTGLCTWYSPRGRIPLDELVELHCGLVLAGVNGSSSVNREPSP
jgi:AcrR family transcriptional regulator